VDSKIGPSKVVSDVHSELSPGRQCPNQLRYHTGSRSEVEICTTHKSAALIGGAGTSLKSTPSLALEIE
jgi:hypothetical protein